MWLRVVGYLEAVAVTGLATAIGFALHPRFDFANVIMVYLAGVALIANRHGRAESVFGTVLSVGTFDFLLVPPRGTLAVKDSQYLLTFVIMLGVGLLISDLTLRVRRQAEEVRERERRNQALYRLSEAMSRSRSKREIARVAQKEISEAFGADVAIQFKGDELDTVAASESQFECEEAESRASELCLSQNQRTGRGTQIEPSARGVFIPLLGGQGPFGVVCLLPSKTQWPFSPAQESLLETFTNSLGLALERTFLAKESQEAKFQAESERIRNALLSSISHDLRTPLTAIAGAASSIQAQQGDFKELAGTIYDESIRLNLQVQNLLDMTRLQSGEVRPRLEWHSLEEIVANALARATEVLAGREVTADLTRDLPLIEVDGELLGKVLLNLLENAATHTPPRSAITITADNMREFVRLNVADRGPGLKKGEETQIFERFIRRDARGQSEGFGLGLAICRAIMKLHGGRVWAENRTDGTGAVFHVELIKPKRQPEVPHG